MKIVSLLPSATEIICALGGQYQLVGRSHECDYPPEVQGLPICTAPKFKVGPSSEAIDQSVQDLVGNGLSVYEVDTEILDALAPDLIVTQSHCEVCAVSFDEVREAVRRLSGVRARVVDLNPQTYEDVFADIRQVGIAMQCPDRAEELIARMQQSEKAVSRRLPDRRRSVACIEWLKPLMNAGNWMPTIVEKAGGHDVFAGAGEKSHYLEWDAVRDANPEVLLLMPCGFSIERTLKEIHLLCELPGWRDLRAVKQNEVYVVDGNQYFNRPGPRLVDSLEIVAEILHPGHFPADHRELGWIRLQPEHYAA